MFVRLIIESVYRSTQLGRLCKIHGLVNTSMSATSPHGLMYLGILLLAASRILKRGAGGHGP